MLAGRAISTDWGEVIYMPDQIELWVRSGKLNLNAIDLGIPITAIEIDGKPVACTSEDMQTEFTEQLSSAPDICTTAQRRKDICF